MPGMNSQRLANAQQTLPFDSAVIQIQAVREEAVTIWANCINSSGSTCEIRGSPDLQAHALAGGRGAVLHTIITSGTAGAGQTKVNAAGHAVVVVQAHPLMMIRLVGGLGTDVWSVWAIE